MSRITENGNLRHYRDQQIMGHLTLVNTSAPNPLTPWLENTEEEAAERCWKPKCQAVCCGTCSQRNGCEDKPGPIAKIKGHTNMEGEDLRDPTSRERTLSDSYSLKGKELAPSREESPYWLSSAEWLSLKPYSQQQQKQTQQFHLYIRINICIHV